MATLRIGTRSFAVSDHRVAREADRMFKLAPPRRAHRLDGAKTRLARAGGSEGIEGREGDGAVRSAVAIILSQGISEI
jgi:hypothetical protein